VEGPAGRARRHLETTILSRPLNVGAYSLIYASGGKNIPAGLAVILIKESLLACTRRFLYYTNHGR
jgi:phosphoserine aminotransferase